MLLNILCINCRQWNLANQSGNSDFDAVGPPVSHKVKSGFYSIRKAIGILTNSRAVGQAVNILIPTIENHTLWPSSNFVIQNIAPRRVIQNIARHPRPAIDPPIGPYWYVVRRRWGHRRICLIVCVDADISVSSANPFRQSSECDSLSPILRGLPPTDALSGLANPLWT